MAYVHVAHDCHLGSHLILANAASLAGHITIGDHAIIETDRYPSTCAGRVVLPAIGGCCDIMQNSLVHAGCGWL